MAFALHIILSLFVTVLGLSDFRRCADSKCEVPISHGEAILSYKPDEEHKIPAKIGDHVVIYSKDAGNDTSLWGVEVNGKRGYMPKAMIKELNVLHKKLDHIVPTVTPNLDERHDANSPVLADILSSIPDTMSSFSVLDGTTIFVNTTEDVLGTKPLQTDILNTHPIFDITSSASIDATSTSKNKLDEPNNSIISETDSSTTSTDKVDNANTIGESKTNAEVEDLEKSAEKNLQPSKDKSQEIASEVKKSENSFEPEVNDESQGKEPLSNGGKSTLYTHKPISEEGADDLEEEDDVGDDITEDDEEEEDDDNDDDDAIGDDDVDGEDDDVTEGNSKDIVEDSQDSTERPRDLTSSGSNVLNNMEKAPLNEPIDQKMLQESDEIQTGTEQTSTSINIPEMPLSSQPVAKDNEKEEDIDDNSKKQKMENSEPFSESSQTPIEKPASETNENLGSSNGSVPDMSSSGVDNTVNLKDGLDPEISEDIKSGDIPKIVSSAYDLFGKINAETKKEEEKVVTENSQELPIIYPNNTTSWDTYNGEENMVDEHISLNQNQKTYSDLHATEDVPTSPENALEEESAPSTVLPHSGEAVEEDNSLQKNVLLTDFTEQSQGQDTCDVGCTPEREDLGDQETDFNEAESSFFSSLWESAVIMAANLIPSTSKDMSKYVADIFQTTQTFLIITAVTVLLFTLGYYYLEKQHRDGVLISRINHLEKELMVSLQEKYTLKDELENAKERMSSFSSSIDSGEDWSSLRKELDECTDARLELEDQVASLEKELEAATEAGLELNRMMSELLSSQNGSDTLVKSVEHLQKQLDNQQSTINTMNANLKAKHQENEHLESELKLALERVQNLEDQLSKALESKSADAQRLCRELDTLQDVLDETRKTLTAREGEVTILRECLSNAENVSNGGESNIPVDELLNVGRLRAQIDNLTKERDELSEKLQGEEDARKLLEDHMKIVSEEVTTLRAKYEEADRGKMEAQTRLNVLSNYFKEKETQLQKELGLQEAKCIQKEGDAMSTVEQIKAFQEEIDSYKAQNEILKKEIVDQERSMKSQIAIFEKKAHENWVAARQAERRLEETKQEASQLRNMLTMSGRRMADTIPGPEVGKSSERGSLDLERNGEIPSSPAHLAESQEMTSSPLPFQLPGSPSLLPPGGQPLPPGPFSSLPPLFLPPGATGLPFPMPPPPGGLFPDDMRPPPLGRISSPPPEPHGNYSHFDHAPSSPPPNRPYRSSLCEDSPSRYRHQNPPPGGSPFCPPPFLPGKWEECGDSPRSSFRPLHRDSTREPKGSTLSSGHSTESLEKSSWHSRV